MMLEQARARLVQAQETRKSVQAIRETATSPRREVSVSAEWGGRIASIEFPTSGYKRMPAKELAALLLATITAAQDKVQESAAAVLTPVLPEGIDARALLAPGADPAQLLRSASGARVDEG